MAYIFKRKKNGRFYPFDNLGNNLAELDNSSEDGFYVDTLLAYPISVLNNKGYSTKSCCEGHPLCEVGYKLAEEYKQSYDDEEISRDRIFEIRKNSEGVNYICYTGDPDIGAEIVFLDGIKLPSIPVGWTYNNNNSIHWNCDSYMNPTDYYKRLIFAIEKLTIWAEQIEDTGRNV